MLLSQLENWNGEPNREIDLFLMNFLAVREEQFPFPYRFASNVAVGVDQKDIIVRDVDGDYGAWLMHHDEASVLNLPRYTSDPRALFSFMSKVLPEGYGMRLDSSFTRGVAAECTLIYATPEERADITRSPMMHVTQGANIFHACLLAVAHYVDYREKHK